MKNLLSLILVLILSPTTGFAQACQDDFVFFDPVADWDWRDEDKENWKMYIEDLSKPGGWDEIKPGGPFAPGSGGNNLNTVDAFWFSLTKDNQIEDGWVLLYRAFGSPGSVASAVPNPTFALYNRFTGVMRVLFMP